MKKRMVAILVAALAVSSLAGCGSSTSGSDTSSSTAGSSSLAAATTAAVSTDTAETTASADNSGKEITIWMEKIFSDDANAQMQARFEQYGEENGVTVHVEQIGATDFTTKLNAAIEAGQNIPDIISSNTAKVLNYYPNIPCRDVNDLVDEINADRPYMASAMEGTLIGDTHYYVPFDNSTTLMFIRKDKFDEAGITEMPKTWDEVFEDAKKISDPDNDFYGLGMGCGENDDDDENTFRQYFWDEGGYLFDEDGNITVDNEAIRGCINNLADLYNQKVIPPDATTWDAGGNNGSYLAGRTGIVFNAPTLYNALKGDEQYADLLSNTVIMAPPAGSDNSIFMAFPVGFSIMNSCQDVDLASDVIKYMIEKDWYDQYVDSIAPIFAPVFEDEKSSATWTDDQVNAEALAYAENASGYYGYPVKTIEGRAVAAKHVYTYPVVKMVNQVITGSETMDEAMDQITRQIQDFQDQVAQ